MIKLCMKASRRRRKEELTQHTHASWTAWQWELLWGKRLCLHCLLIQSCIPARSNTAGRDCMWWRVETHAEEEGQKNEEEEKSDLSVALKQTRIYMMKNSSGISTWMNWSSFWTRVFHNIADFIRQVACSVSGWPQSIGEGRQDGWVTSSSSKRGHLEQSL